MLNRSGEQFVEQDIKQILKEIFTWVLNMEVEQAVERDIERILDGIFTRILKREFQHGIERYVGQNVRLQIIREELSIFELQNTTILPLTSVINF